MDIIGFKVGLGDFFMGTVYSKQRTRTTQMQMNPHGRLPLSML